MRHSRAWFGRRYAFLRILPLLTFAFVPFACQDGTAPNAGDPDPFVFLPAGPVASSVSVASGVEGYFALMPPLAEQASLQGEFHPGLAPRIDICLLDGTGTSRHCVAAPPAVQFAPAQIALVDDHYQVDWKTVPVQPKEAYRIAVALGALELGHVDLVFGHNANEARDLAVSGLLGAVAGQTLPIKFRIAHGVLCRGAPGCVETSVSAEGGAVTAGDGLARVVFPAGWIEAALGKVNVYVGGKPANGGACLPTALPQLSACESLRMEPAVGPFLGPVTVGMCVDATDPRSAHAQLASYDPARGFELLAPAPAPPLACGPTQVALAGLMAHFTDVGAVEAVRLELVRGDTQTASVSTELPVQPTVRAFVRGSDGAGVPLPDIDLTFDAVAVDGRVTTQTARTDSSGLASVPWRLGPTAGTNTMRVHGAALDTVTLHATGIVAYRVSGSVSFAGGATVSGVPLELFGDTLAPAIRTCVSGAEGAYAFDPVVPGSYWTRNGGNGLYVRMAWNISVSSADVVQDLSLLKRIDPVDPPDGAVVSPIFPVLRWTPVPEAVEYYVRVTETATGKTAGSMFSQADSGALSARLAPNTSYTWTMPVAFDAQDRNIARMEGARRFTTGPDRFLFGRVYAGLTNLPGITLDLRQGTSMTGPVLATTVSGVDGLYSSGGLPPGQYGVTAQVGSEYLKQTRSATLSTTSYPLDIPLMKPIQVVEPAPGSVATSIHPTLSWVRLPGAATHDILLYQVTPWTQIEVARGITGTEYTVQTPLTPGMRYSWSLSAMADASHVMGSGNAEFTAPGGSFVVQGTLYYGGVPHDGIAIQLRKDTTTGPLVQTISTSGGGKYAFDPVPGGRYAVSYAFPNQGPSGWQILNVNASTTLDFWAVAPLVLLGPPMGTVVTGQPTLTWAPLAGAASYTVTVSEMPGWKAVESQTTTSTAYTVQAALKPGTQYWWSVFARDPTGHPVASTSTWFMTTGGVSNLGGTFYYATVGRDGVTLELHEGTLEGPLARSVTTAGGGKYSFIGVPRGHYILKYSIAGFGSGWRDMDLLVADTTFDFWVGRPLTLLGPASGAVVTEPVTLSWENVAGAVRYWVVVRDLSNGEAIVDSTTLTATSYSVRPTLKAATQYSWYARAIDASGHDIATGYSRFYTQGGEARVSGTVYYATVGQDGVPVELHQDSVRGPVVQSGTTANGGKYSLGPVPPGRYVVKYVMENGASGWTTLDLGPGAQSFDFWATRPLEQGEPTGGSEVTPPVTLQWEDVQGAASYEVQVRKSDDWSLVENTTAATNSYTVQAVLQPGTRYSWNARALDAAGHPIASSWFQFNTAL